MPQAVNSFLSEKALNLMLSSFAFNLQKASKQISQHSHHCLWYLEFMLFWWYSKYTCGFQERASFNLRISTVSWFFLFSLSGAGDQSQSPDSCRQTPALNDISTLWVRLGPFENSILFLWPVKFRYLVKSNKNIYMPINDRKGLKNKYSITVI